MQPGSSIYKISQLSGNTITRWVATEMALSEDACESGAVLWNLPSIPYLQLISIDIQLSGGVVYRMLSQLDDGGDFFGLYLVRQEVVETPRLPDEGAVFRTRELTELPLGPALVSLIEVEGESTRTAEIIVGNRALTFRAAELMEEHGGNFNISEPGESILVQVDGHCPSFS